MRTKILLIGLFIIIFIIAIVTGRYDLTLVDYLDFFHHLIQYFKTGEYETSGFTILYAIRLPRILLALSIGAGLSLAGFIFQQLFKNPIASPDILGVSSGASFGAALAMILATQMPFLVQIFSFGFGLLAVFLVYLIKSASRNENILYLVLSGIIISAFFSALLAGIKYIADPYQQLPSIVFWTMGGLYKATWANALFCFFVVSVFSFIFYQLSYKINILSIDEDLAKTMGIKVSTLRISILILASLMVSICVSIAGIIGWVALIVPHITRIILKNDPKIYLYTGLIGGMVLLLMDTIARSIHTSEIPVGILTSLVGAPILGYLLIVKKTI